MSMTISDALRNLQAAEYATAIGSGGDIEVRTGTKPATPDDTATGTLLATLDLSATPGTQTGGDGVFTFNAISTDTNAAATGTPGYCRVRTSGGAGVVDLDAGVGSGDVDFDQGIVATGEVDIDSLTCTVPNG